MLDGGPSRVDPANEVMDMDLVRPFRRWLHRDPQKAVERVLSRRAAQNHVRDVRSRTEGYGAGPVGADPGLF